MSILHHFIEPVNISDKTLLRDLMVLDMLVARAALGHAAHRSGGTCHNWRNRGNGRFSLL
jgi:hypothetical protein